MMDIKRLSSKYRVELLNEDNIEEIYNLCIGNPLFYKHCPPFVSKEGIKEDLKALPPGKTLEDKFFIGFYENKELIAIMDLILGFPDEKTAFVGLFMVNKDYQLKGIGSSIIGEFSSCIKEFGYNYIRLGYVKTNPQSKVFWHKCGFEPTGVVSHQEQYDVVVMQKKV